MSDHGWRTIVIDSESKLSCQNGALLIRNHEEKSIPLKKISNLIITVPQVSLSAPLMVQLSQQSTQVLFCNEKKEPACQLIPIHGGCQSAGTIMRQAGWSDEKRETVWQDIVKTKIQNQKNLLLSLNLPIPTALEACIYSVKVGDSDNREGLAARLYFSALFGDGFLRHSCDDTNAALDYGYAIIKSAMCRILSLHGYHSALGIHHRSKVNPFNLACDLMEPFRPYVDEIVYHAMGSMLDWELKKKLIALLQTQVHWNGRLLKLQSAMEQYALHIFRQMDASILDEGG